MLIAISSQGRTLDSPLEPRFGRAPGFVVVDDETGKTSFLDNSSNAGLPQAAGVQTAQMIVDAGVQAVITGRVGPKAETALDRAGIRIHFGQGGTVAQALEEFKAQGSQPSAPQGQGGGGQGMGGGGGRGMGGGGGRGMGGGGRGMGGGMGSGRGRS